MNVLVINGPNLNLLGTREPEIYGSDSLAEIEHRCRNRGNELGLDVEFKQSNYEGQIVEWIQEAIPHADAIVLNAGAYTHTSIAIHDALRAYPGFKVELHISNPHQRESFRRHSYVSAAADAVVAGLGVQAYEQIIERLPTILQTET